MLSTYLRLRDTMLSGVSASELMVKSFASNRDWKLFISVHNSTNKIVNF